MCIYIGSTYHTPAKPNIFRLLQFLNMSFIPEQHLKYSPLPRMHSPAGTDFVEKELRSSSSRLLQSLNISQKPITLSVLKCETSSCFTDCSAQINLAEQSEKENKNNFILHINEEREIPGRQKVVRGLNVPVLTSHAGLNPRSKSGYEPERRVINMPDTCGNKISTKMSNIYKN